MARYGDRSIRPSFKRKVSSESLSLNLVPMLDALVTLIAFLLFTASFISIVTTESPLPITRSFDIDQTVHKKPIQVTVSIKSNESEIWTPFGQFQAIVIPHLPEGKPNLQALHERLIGLKEKFPQESKVILAPHAKLTYEDMVGVMDAIRVLEPTDPALFYKNPKTGVDESLTALFPNIMFGNLLGGS